ncbi:membrane protein [Salmonella enterica subsp. enterica]|uniref:Membrane protein n=1 Tax=Salmonella enterica I TaxID=59201 RepID=A0A379VYX3_SALET|nr:membrane protein [Salmonella enterica subsp. enterica]
MTIQQWLFSFKGRIGRRDFWIWIGLWFAGMLALFSLAGKNLLDIQTAAFCLVCLLWPTAAVMVKRLHDRGRSGAWALLMILAWDAAGRKLGDAAGDVAVGRRAIYSDADPGDDAYRSGRVCRCSGGK